MTKKETLEKQNTEPKAVFDLPWENLMPMLIVAIMNGDKKGSAETILMDLAKWLDKEGVKVL